MTIGALSLGGMTLSWRRPQYQYWNRAMRGASAAVLASDRGSGVSAAARHAARIAPVSAQETRAPLASAASGAASAGGAARIVLAPSEMPYIPEGYGPEELATRTRIQFPGLGVPPEEWAEAQSGLPWETEDAEGEGLPGVEDAKSAAEVAEDGKCKTCEERKYKDGSDDPGVSFKTAARVDPMVAQAAVRGHEQEHVFRERAKAEREDRKVISQSVTYHTGICPECGKFYISGGTTRTVTAADNTKDFLRRRFSGGEDNADFDITA